MAGKVGMHRKLMHPARAEEVRAKIRAALIVKALEDHVIAGKDMTATQVSAALGLLRKSIPDLAAIEHTGKDGERLFERIERQIVRPPDSNG